MMTSQTISCSLPGLPAVPKNQGFALNSQGIAAIPRHSFGYCDKSEGDRRLRSLTTSRCFLLDVVVQSGVDPPGQLHSGASPGSWTWIWGLGAVVSVVLPLTKGKWGPLLKLKNEADAVVEAAEEVTEMVERVAEGVDKVAEDVAEILPEGGKLRGAVEFVEHVAEQTAKDAHLVEGFIDKAEELEKEIEEGIEPILDRPATNQPAAGGDEVAK